MSKKTIFFLIFAIILLVVGIGFFVFVTFNNNSDVITNEIVSNPSETSKPEGFKFYDADGNEVEISNYEGIPIALILFNTTTEDSFNDLGLIEKIYDEYKGEIVFLVINTEEKSANVIDTMEACQYPFTIYYDTENLAQNYYSYSKLPALIFINSDGTISKQKEGSITEDSLTANLDLLIENY